MSVQKQEFSRVLFAASGVVFICICIFYAYIDTFRLIPLADQLCFLIDTINDKDFFSTFAHTYSYNRTRCVAPGDTNCFRPLFFFILSLEKVIFGNQFALWQSVGLILHCVITLQIFFLIRQTHVISDVFFTEHTGTELRDRQKNPVSTSNTITVVAFASALFFSVNVMTVGMVTWAHLHGYMVFIILILAAFGLFPKCACVSDIAQVQRVAVWCAAWLLLAFASFTYELGQIVAVIWAIILSISLFRSGRRQASLASLLVFGSIAVVYQTINYLDYHAHVMQFQDDLKIGQIFKDAFSPLTAIFAARFVAFTLVQPFFPWNVTTFPSTNPITGRILVNESTRTAMDLNPGSVWSIAVIVVIAILVVYLLVKRRRYLSRRFFETSLVYGLTIAAYCLANVLGRMNMRPNPSFLSYNSYYAYLPLALCTICVGTAVSAAVVTMSRKLHRRTASVFLLVSILVASGAHAQQTRQSVNAFAATLTPLRTYFNEISTFIRKHHNEADFGVTFGALNDEVWNGVPKTTIFFRKYENNYNPAYICGAHNGKLVWIDRETYKNTLQQTELPLFPDIVQVGNGFHLYAYQGKYLIVQYAIGMESRVVATVTTLEEARKILAEYVRAQ